MRLAHTSRRPDRHLQGWAAAQENGRPATRNGPRAFQISRLEKLLATERRSYYKVGMKLQFGRKLIILVSVSLLFGAALRQLHAQSTPQEAAPATPQARAQPNPEAGGQESPARQHQHDGTMPGMNMEDDRGNHAQAGAMQSMAHGHHMDSAHMRMTPARAASADDRRRADQIAATLAQAIERYHIFAPNLPQAQYHFTNYWNGYLEGFTFDPARPTSLLYKKTKDGYELIGAMYTAPRTASLEELDERVPLGVAHWHQHTNLCMPKRGEAAHADWRRFGLTGSISSEEECQEAGGRFYPVIFGWMVHIYPFESSLARVWAQ